MTKKNCEICKNIPDKAHYEDPFNDLEGASPEYKKEITAIRQLKEAGKDLRKCPNCGTTYSYDVSYYTYMSGSERLMLDIHRLKKKK